MKEILLAFMNKQIVFMLSLLGFSLAATQCAAQYGAPTTFRAVRGNVTIHSRDNKPIANIRVIVENDTYYSDSDGNVRFVLYRNEMSDQQGFMLHFDDIDGAKNGTYYSQDKMFFLKPKEENELDVTMIEGV